MVCDHLAPARVASVSEAPFRLAELKSAFVKSALERLAPDRSADEKTIEFNDACERSMPESWAWSSDEPTWSLALAMEWLGGLPTLDVNRTIPIKPTIARRTPGM